MLEANRDDQFAVWELGMNHPGEIAALARIASADAAIITNIGIAHIEFMGSREAIAREKGALAGAIDRSGLVVLNADDEFSASIAQRTRARVILAGIEKRVVRAIEVQQPSRGCAFTIDEDAAAKAGLENSAVSKDASEAAEMLSEIVRPGDLVLIKGSRSSRTELVLDEFAKLQPAGGNAR